MTPPRSPLRALLLLGLLAALARGGEAPALLDGAGDLLPAHALARLGTTRWRQQLSIVSLAYSGDGKVLACGSYEDGVGLFDAATGRKLRHLLAGGDAYPLAVALSADGKTIVALRKLGLHILDAKGAERARVDQALNDRAYRIALSPDGRYVVTMHYPDRARLLKADGAVVAYFKGGAAAALGPGGKTLLLGGDKRVRVWDVGTGKELRRLDGEARLLAATADGRTLAARGKGAIRLWDTNTGEVKRTIPVPDADLHVEQTEMLALSADGRTVALAGSGHLFAWDCATGKERLRRIDRSWYTAVALSPDGRVLAWGGSGNPVVHRWDLVGGRELLLPMSGHENHVHGLAFAPGGKALASGASDGTVRLWRLDAAGPPGARPSYLTLPTGEVMMPNLGGRVAWSPDGRLLALAHSDYDVCLREAATGKVVRVLDGAKGCYCVAFSPDGKLVAVGDSYFGQSSNPQGRVLLWEAATGRLLRTFAGHGNVVRSVAFSPDGKRLASGSDGVRVWDVSSGRQVRRFRTTTYFIDALAFTPDGRALVAGGDEAVAWDLATGAELRRFGGEHRGVSGVALSPDGRLLATSGEDGVVRLWDFAAGTERAALAGHVGRVFAVAFAPDGKVLASAGKDTTVLLWDVAAALRGGAAKAPPRLAKADFDRLWADLAKADAAAGDRAVWALAAEPAAAVALFKERLSRAARGGDAARVARLIAQLDDDDFGTREKADQELERLGLAAVPALRAALARKPSAEARRRVTRLLVPHEARSVLLPPGDALRAARAVHALELIGTPPARQVLQELRDGPPSRISEDAREALERLDRRKGSKR
jgi:WD40 repeat protein